MTSRLDLALSMSLAFGAPEFRELRLPLPVLPKAREGHGKQGSRTKVERAIRRAKRRQRRAK